MARPYQTPVGDNGDCVQALNKAVGEYYQLCREIAVEMALGQYPRESNARLVAMYADYYQLKNNSVCREYTAQCDENRKQVFAFTQEINHYGDDLSEGRILTPNEKLASRFGYIIALFGYYFRNLEELNRSILLWIMRGVDNLVVYLCRLDLYDYLVVSLSMLSPWFPLAYLILYDYSIAFMAPLMAYTGVDFRLIWIYVLVNVFYPGFAIGLVFALCFHAIVKYRRRTQESFTTICYTISYFWAFGLFLEISRRYLFDHPNLHYFGLVGFFAVAIACFWGRRVVVVEYTYCTWSAGVASAKSKPMQISVEVDFPYTLLNPLNRLRMWYAGIPWVSAAGTLFKLAGIKLPTVPESAVPAAFPWVAGTTLVAGGGAPSGAAIPLVYGTPAQQAARPASKVRFGDPAGPSTSGDLLVGPASVNLSASQLLGAGFDPNDFWTVTTPPPVQEGKGKNKKGRGQLKFSAKNKAPVHFKKVATPFWMSDPEIEIDQISEWFDDDLGSGWRAVAADDWDTFSGGENLQIVSADGQVQYIYYDPADDDVELEGFDVVPGQPISNLKIIQLRKRHSSVDAPTDQVHLVLAALARQQTESAKRFESLEGAILVALKSITSLQEANGKTNALPAQPPPAYVNPMAPYMTEGCFHHPDCKVAKSSKTPCGIACASSSCIHNAKCKPVVPEAAKPSRSALKKAKKAAATVAADWKTLAKGKEVASEASASTRDSAVTSNPLVEYSEQLNFSVVVVESPKARAYGVYTDRGVVTQSHIVAGADTFKIFAPYAPGNCEVVSSASIISAPGDSDLILVPIKVANCRPAAFTSLACLNKATNVPSPRGSILCPSGHQTGIITYKPDCATELLIQASTRAGMCGSPYVVSNKIVGFHAFGNNNGVDNGAFAVTAELLKWLNAQPKN
jgi:hypothetical protein